MGYYIISLEHTYKQNAFMCLWRPNNQGYCNSKQMAGIYDEPEKGYHDSLDELPVSEADAEKLFITVAIDGEERQVIPNCVAIHDALGLKFVKGDLKRK